MKKIVSVIILVSIISLNLAGQARKDAGRPDIPKKDTSSITIPSDDPEYGYLKKKYRLPDNIIINPDTGLNRRYFDFEPMRRSYSDRYRAETFPGADLFYAKKPYLMRPSDRSFIIKPDTVSKYYLIIKDPFTGRITK